MLAQLAVPSLDLRIERLGRDSGPGRDAGYATLDQGVVREAPWAPFGTWRTSTFVSAAVDLSKVIWSPIFGADLASFRFKGLGWH